MDRKGVVERSSRKGVVVVLGAALVAVAVMLALAGVVVERNSEPAPTAVAGAGAAPAHGAPSRERDEQIPDLAVREPAPVCDATVPMRVRVKRLLGDSTTYYTGHLVVEVAGRVLVSTTLVNRDALALEVPANATSLRFIAPDHVVLEESLPLRASGKESIVELEPDATLAVCSLGLPLGEDGSVQFRVDAVSGWHSRPRTLRDMQGAFEVPCAVGEAFEWRADFACGTRWVSLTGSEPELRRGERRVLTLDFASLPVQRYRVVGPSPRLMSELEVHRRVLEGAVTSALPLDSSGCFEVPRDRGGKWCVRAGVGEVELTEEQEAETIVLRPSMPLLGLGLRRVADAPPQDTVAFDANGEVVSGLASLHVFAREKLPPTLYLGSNFAGSVAVPCDHLPHGDVVWVEPSALPAPGRLMLHVQGVPPAADVAPRLRVQLRSGAQISEQVVAADMQFEVPPDGSFGLRWTLPTCAGPWIAQDLRVASGATLELTAEWPIAHRWTGEVEKFAAMPLERRWHRVSWGEGPGLFGRGMTRVGDDGRFELFLFAEDTLDPVWRVFWGLTTVPAQAEVADPVRRHLVVRPLAEVRWVNVVVDAKPPWMVFVWSTHAPRCRPGSWHNEQRPIPVPTGEVRHGGLLRGDELLAWFRIDAQGDTVHVQTAGGRTIELRPRAACANRMVCLVGPGGQWDQGHDLSSTSPLRVFAPDGTVRIAVFDGNQPDGAVREIPLGTDDVIAID